MMKVGLIHLGTLNAGSHYIFQAIIEFSLRRDIELYGIQLNHDEKSVHSKALNKDTLLKWEETREIILASFPNELSEKHHPVLIEKMNKFDSVVILGPPTTVLKEVISQTKANVLQVPISILNDMEGSDLTLGYDTALNAIVNNILKIQDTIRSLLYSKPRVFCVQIPGNSINPLLENVATAVDGHIITNSNVEERMEAILEIISSQYQAGKNFFLLITNETTDPNQIEHYLTPKINMDYKWNTIDESQCVGPYPTAVDRILAKHLVENIEKWIQANGKSNRLLVKGQKVVFG